MQQLGTAGVKGIAGYLQQSSAQNAAQNEANQRIQSAPTLTVIWSMLGTT
jgi:hypothetical protein